MSGKQESKTLAEQHKEPTLKTPPEEPTTPPEPPEEPAVAEEPQEPIVLKFVPRFPGEFLYTVPAHDLTQAEVDRLDPWALANATAEGPDGTALYQPVDEKK